MFYIGSDHAGFELKEKIKKFLDKKSLSFSDLGAYEKVDSDDYPDYALKVCKAILKDQHSKGLLLCGTGSGMAIFANRFPKIKAAVCWNSLIAKKAREENHANVLVLPSREISAREAVKIVDSFISAKESKSERHLRRIKKIDKIIKF